MYKEMILYRYIILTKEIIMIYDETNSIAFHIMSNIGTWIKGEDETHVFQCNLKDIEKTFSITID